MNTSEVNIPLLRKAVEWAEAEAAKPAGLCEWNQAMWVVPATQSEAKEWGYWAHGETLERYNRAPECGTCYCIAGFVVAQTQGPGEIGDFIEEAAQALGMDYDQAYPLFSATNSIADVRRIAEDIAGERL